ncbi:Uu.00g097550.m01.CDS01 [Anthostomella pinea]|uniref:Uu.00g097550.m01.CDS01 n=1 Tax=Anthostomella pinea TaxID=933095 RepID=A0AAI8VDF7_9PEZI|nr:Uu.00g097550.m01.CDS01 [Anthostomella pinea]
MKYGQRFEEASVPGWSLHNIDYTALKHQIKTHTSKAQATAIAIPGQQDHALEKFENAFYHELCSQHGRVHLFVTSKADEIARRLRHLSDLLNQLIIRCADSRGVSVKRQRRFSRYQSQIEECGRDTRALARFVDAQVTAFRKILKKYKKWTASTTLSARFNENVLGSPKSFTTRDLRPLQLQYQELLLTLEAASPVGTTASELSQSRSPSRRGSRRRAHTPPALITTYWNEYEHGSEAGDYGDHDDGAYAIYIDPDASADIPGLVYIKTLFTAPVDKMRHWLKRSRVTSASSGSTIVASPSSPETQSLLNHDNRNNNNRHTNNRTTIDSNTTPTDYFSITRPATTPTTDAEATDEEYTSSDDQRHLGSRSFGGEAALVHHKVAIYRDRILTRSVVLAFAAAFVLLIISGVLIATGRHRQRLEVDAGVTVGSVASLFCACMGLGAMLYRQFPTGYMYCSAVWITFLALCVLNGMLLVLVVGSNGL